ncbi:cytochrome P450 [Dendrothele bispora CBS 962.96]|uniref:Cytochrome P450 n=1 Tax=Dendrothele bispora (strain CBS 962.96) TaxID=1314807 RepID=A0A4S8LBY8_DENBC|nr:cytochrome P450 [Dendrothele bispora CBS 962.96]
MPDGRFQSGKRYTVHRYTPTISIAPIYLTMIVGNIIYLNVLGTPIVVINSASTARDLMDKRSSIYSDRPRPDNEMVVPSICSAALSSNLSPELEEQLSFAAFSALAAGLDTVCHVDKSSTFHTSHDSPEIQAEARAEIDSCVGNHRLPTLDDKDSLPFVRSVITEVMRLYPPGPLGVPHSLQQDDVYNDMFLPKKSIIIPNVWYMLRDPEVFNKPEIFNPSRYEGLDSEMQKVTDPTFGFGRRVCPGRYFAENTIFAIVATLLATCEILPPSDSTGKECKSEVPVAGTGAIAFYGPFECIIKPRPETSHLLGKL